MLNQQPLMWAWLMMETDHFKRVYYTALYLRYVTCNNYFLLLAIELRIDRRCTLAELKTRLEEYIQVPSSEFKVRFNSVSCSLLKTGDMTSKPHYFQDSILIFDQ